jgi:hypothetical protein
VGIFPKVLCLTTFHVGFIVFFISSRSSSISPTYWFSHVDSWSKLFPCTTISIYFSFYNYQPTSLSNKCICKLISCLLSQYFCHISSVTLLTHVTYWLLSVATCYAFTGLFSEGMSTLTLFLFLWEFFVYFFYSQQRSKHILVIRNLFQTSPFLSGSKFNLKQKCFRFYLPNISQIYSFLVDSHYPFRFW